MEWKITQLQKPHSYNHVLLAVLCPVVEDAVGAVHTEF